MKSDVRVVLGLNVRRSCALPRGELWLESMKNAYDGCRVDGVIE